MLLEIIRDTFTEKSSSGNMLCNGELLCVTLEDAARAHGVKVQGKTCLPAGQYSVTITPSQRFGRQMILVYTNKNNSCCEHGGISFSGIRIHGGNTAENTEGCILVARVRDSDDRIHDSEEALVFGRVKAAMDAGEKVMLVIRNVAKKAA